MTIYTEDKRPVVIPDPDGADIVILESQQVLVRNECAEPYVVAVALQGPQGPSGSDPIWGAITGTLTDQVDLVSYIAANGGGGNGTFVQPTPPAGATEGNLWYKSDTEDLFVYREISPAVFNWVPIVLGTTNSDTIDGGNY